MSTRTITRILIALTFVALALLAFDLAACVRGIARGNVAGNALGAGVDLFFVVWLFADMRRGWRRVQPDDEA